MIDKDSTLKQLIADAKTRGPTTEAELAARRASFVRGEIGIGSDRDEAAYRDAFRRGDKAEMARLVQASEERVKRAFR